MTKKQVERQDFVDNEVFELIQRLLPLSKQLDWNIEAIGTVRDAIRAQVVEKQNLLSEADFYPFQKVKQSRDLQFLMKQES